MTVQLQCSRMTALREAARQIEGRLGTQAER